MGLPKRTVVLVVGEINNLAELIAVLGKRNVTLTNVSTLAQGLEHLDRSGDSVALILTEDPNFKLADVDAIRRRTAAPLVWGVAPGHSDAQVRAAANVKVVNSITPPVVAQINELMVAQVFNQDIARAIRQSTIEAFGEGFATTTSILQPFVTEVREPLHEVVAFIGFAGPTTSGYLSVSASTAYLHGVHARI